jgi:hypothetical protein
MQFGHFLLWFFSSVHDRGELHSVPTVLKEGGELQSHPGPA